MGSMERNPYFAETALGAVVLLAMLGGLALIGLAKYVSRRRPDAMK